MKKILIVEDDDDYRKLLARKLNKSGYMTFSSTNGQEALRFLKKKTVDLIVLDLIMKKMNGLEFYEKIEKETNKETPILILSNIQLSNINELVTKPQIEGYLIKANTSLAKVIDKIESVLLN